MIKRTNPSTLLRVNNACSYFPCHEDLEDCTFCYCPFYPCQEEGLGRYVYSSRLNKKIWSCKDCGWIHQRKTVDRIYRLISEHGSYLRKDIPVAKARSKTFSDKQTGVVVLGHGSRLKKANALIPEIINGLKRTLGLSKIYPAYLQLAKPDLGQSLEKLAKAGCRRIIIIPFFLFVGNHVSRDIPEIIEQEKKKYPEVRFIYTKNLGEDSRIADIVADKIRENIGTTL
ncbi:MAG: CbiX/SirB N-terminal domain-containing protein [Candidatus Omnitrophota bacterium]|nr:CbiX/SirB N-terminal domain-containing protein [Candidatus Omnitrophota bacterium]